MRVVLKYWDQIFSMVGVRMREAYEMHISAGYKCANIRPLLVLRRVSVYHSNATGRKSDDNGVADS